ncbi:MAG TPA: efflux RND transporter periplasmic adaptor subunit [Flavobacteriales bacterium]|nr:efflux RND transporter periplasmic adaptor subunit [Flavobacteriales bacterium]
MWLIAIYPNGTMLGYRGNAMDKKIERKRFNAKKLLIYGSVIVGVALIVSFYVSSYSVNRIKVDAEKITIDEVSNGTFQEFIPVTGNVMPIKTVYLDAIEGGRVEELFIEDGKMVTAGTPIMRLSNQEFQMDAINREAQLLDQQNNLRNTRLGMDRQSVQLKQDLLQLDVDIKQAKKQFELNKALVAENLVSKNEFEKSEDNYQHLLAKRKLHVQNMRVDSTFRNSQLKQIESSLELIQKNLAFLQGSLENLVIKAPIDGQLSSLKAEIGETKSKGENIAQIDIITDYKIRVRISEHYVSRVVMGLRGSIEEDDKTYFLTVKKVYPEVSNGEFTADMLFEEIKPTTIKRGQSFQLKLELSDKTKAVLLPRGAFYQETGGAWIYVVKDGKAQKREIKLGRQNPDYYEVLDGLEPGEQVVTSKYTMFENADELIIESKK